jgi:hypothetical protein
MPLLENAEEEEDRSDDEVVVEEEEEEVAHCCRRIIPGMLFAPSVFTIVEPWSLLENADEEEDRSDNEVVVEEEEEEGRRSGKLLSKNHPWHALCSVRLRHCRAMAIVRECR